MKKFLLLINVFVFLACAKEKALLPLEAREDTSLEGTKWEMISWNLGGGLAKRAADEGDHYYYNFIKGNIVQEINQAKCCPFQTIGHNYQKRGDTLIVRFLQEEKGMKIEQWTATHLTFTTFGRVNLTTKEKRTTYESYHFIRVE